MGSWPGVLSPIYDVSVPSFEWVRHRGRIRDELVEGAVARSSGQPGSALA